MQIKKYLRRYEQWCKDWKGTMYLGWFLSSLALIIAFLTNHLIFWFWLIFIFFWLCYGIGYEIPQNLYSWLRKKLC